MYPCGRFSHLHPYRRAARKEYVIERELEEEVADRAAGTLDHGDFIWRKHAPNEVCKKGRRTWRLVRWLCDDAIAGSHRSDQRSNEKLDRIVPRRHDEGSPFGLISHPCRSERKNQRPPCAPPLHPDFQILRRAVYFLYRRKNFGEPCFEGRLSIIRPDRGIEFLAPGQEFRAQPLQLGDPLGGTRGGKPPATFRLGLKQLGKLSLLGNQHGNTLLQKRPAHQMSRICMRLMCQEGYFESFLTCPSSRNQDS